MNALLYFIPIFLVIDPFVSFFFRRKGQPKYKVSDKQIAEQLFKMVQSSVRDILDGDRVRLENLGMITIDKKFLLSELYIVHLFMISCCLQGIVIKKAVELDICGHMLSYFYSHLVTQLGFDIIQMENQKKHLLERFQEYHKLLNSTANKWLLPLATLMVENIRGKEVDNYLAIHNMIGEICLLLNQVPLVFERLQCEYKPILPEFYELPPRNDLVGELKSSIL